MSDQPQAMISAKLPLRPAPARVQMALAYLDFVATKTSPLVVGSEPSLATTIDGQELEVEEKEVHVAACKLLTAYFKGEWQPADWEQSDSECMGNVRCPSCMGQKQNISGEACPTCGGRGHLKVSRF